jgi:hypothetical protein
MPAAIPIAIVAGAAISGSMASNASKKAAAAQARSADRTTDLQYEQYMQTREDQAPWREAGGAALSQLSGGLAPGGEYNRRFSMSDYQQDPGYQFRLSEGQRGIENAAAARGSRYSGATLKALARFNSDQASQEYGNAYNRFQNDMSSRFNRMASVAGLGQTANNQVAAAGQNYANQAGQAIQNAGAARASGYVGSSNAIGNAIGQGINAFGQQQYLNSLSGSGYGTPTQAGYADLNANAMNQTANFNNYGAGYSP